VNDIAYPIFHDERILFAFNITSSSPEAAHQERLFVSHIATSFLVMLATRGIVKERHEIKKSQQLTDNKPHKKGSGGYTIIRTPEAHEIEGGTHASPRPHFRRGHIRKLDPEDKTRWIWVSSCFVNGEPEVARKSYLVRGDV
jgi:hypothetical protein